MERKRPRRTRERILETALRLFNGIGEPNVPSSAIADELGISPGNLYYHFRNKDEIVGALFERFESELDALLGTPQGRRITFEDAWLFLHLLFESIWRYRFVYRDLNDLLSRNRRLELRFRAILDRKQRTAHALCSALAGQDQLAADPRELEALATSMVVVATWWLSWEHVRNARRFDEPAYQSAAIARGAYHVLVLIAPYLSADGHALFRRLASEYLEQ